MMMMMMMVVVAVEYYVYQLSPFGQVRFVWLGEKHQRLCVCQFKIISTVTSSHFGARGLGSPRAPPVPLQAR